MSKFIPTTKRNGACYVCGDESGKCRRPQHGEIHLCMNYGDARIGQLENGYKCIANKGRGWATFKLDNTENWADQERSNWQERKARRQQQQQAEAEARKRRSLSAVERDRQYRQLLAELTLHPEDRASLIRRGFTHQEIDLCGFKSVEQYQQLQARYSELLPGIGINGRSLVNYNAGYLCPVRNKDGLVVACQVRLRVLPKGEKNRYRWVASGKRGHILHFFPESGNPEGELPLAVQRPMGEPKGIALAEGIGAKPFLVSQRLNMVVIGAAGGQWAISSATFRETLDSLSAELNGLKIIHLFPDAGDVQNPQVMHRLRRVIALLTKWGWTVQVGWWGQVDKTHPDIDELESGYVFEWLTPEEFLELSERFIRIKAVREAQAKLNSLTYPALVVNQRYLDIDFADTGIQFVQSPMGTGKTERIKRLRQECQHNGKRLLLLGSRNGLLFQTCLRAGIEHLRNLQTNDGVLTAMMLRHTDTLAMCVDSLWRLHAENWAGATVVIDEAESVIEHLLDGNTCKKRRAQLCIKLGSIVQTVCSTGGRVILMDAGLTDVSIDYIKELAQPFTPIFGVVNTYKPDTPWSVGFSSGTTDGVKGFINDDSNILRAILECLEDGGIPVIPTDSQEGAEALERQLIEAGYPGGLRVDGITSELDPLVKLFLTDPNQFIRDRSPNWLIYTPTAESGLSIDEPYFTAMFALFKGVVTTKIQMQMMGRVRLPIPRYVFTVAYGFKDDDCSTQLPDLIERRLLQYHTSNNLLIGLAEHLSASDDPTDADRLAALGRLFDPQTGSWNNPHLKTWAKLKARANYSKANLRDELKAALVADGHQVEDVVNFRAESVKDEFKGLRDDIKEERAAAIANSKDITTSRALEILQSESATLAERNQAHKAILADAVPGVPLTPEFILKAQISNRGEWLKQIRMDWMLKHPEVQTKLDRSAWRWHLSQPLVMPQDIRAYSLKLEVLEELGLPELLDRERVFIADSTEVTELMKTAQSKPMRRKLHTAFGITVTAKTDPILFIKRLFKRVGARLYCDKQIRTKDGKRKRLYKINPDYWTDPDRRAVLEAFDCKYSAMVDSGQNLRAEQSENHAGQGIESGTALANRVYKNDECCATQELAEVTVCQEDVPVVEAQTPQAVEMAQHWQELAPSSVLVSCWKFGRMFKFRLERFLDEATAVITSILTGESFTVPTSELAVWRDAA